MPPFGFIYIHACCARQSLSLLALCLSLSLSFPLSDASATFTWPPSPAVRFLPISPLSLSLSLRLAAWYIPADCTDERGELSHPSTQPTFYPSPLFRRVEPRARVSYRGSGDYTSYTSSSIQSAAACQLADIVAARGGSSPRGSLADRRDFARLPVLPEPRGERVLINGG